MHQFISLRLFLSLSLSVSISLCLSVSLSLYLFISLSLSVPCCNTTCTETAQTLQMPATPNCEAHLTQHAQGPNVQTVTS